MKKIRIAYVNDYAVDTETLGKCASGRYPKHHFWGIYDLLSDPDYDIKLLDNNYFSKLRNPILNKIHSLCRWLWNQLRLLFLTRGCDIIYGTQVCFSMMPISLPAILRHFGLCKAKIIIILQNPNVRIPRFHKYDKLIFLSSEVMSAFLRDSPRLGYIAEHVFWGPDLSFYDALRAEFVTEQRIDFISNGKTGRDNETFLAACESAEVSALLVHNSSFQPSEIQKSNPRLHFVSGVGAGNIISDVENVRLLLSCKAMILPIRPGRPGLYGTTSFLDAIALGMPLIMSDNTMIGVDVNLLQFGFFYKAGDSTSLSACISQLKADPIRVTTLKSNARKFAESNSLHVFQKRMKEIFKEMTRIGAIKNAS